MPVAALLTYFDVLGRGDYLLCSPVWMLQSNALTKRNERNYLLGAIPGLYLVPSVFFALAFGGAFVQSVVDLAGACKMGCRWFDIAGRCFQVLDLQSCFVTFQLNVTSLPCYGIWFDICSLLICTGLGGAVAVS